MNEGMETSIASLGDGSTVSTNTRFVFVPGVSFPYFCFCVQCLSRRKDLGFRGLMTPKSPRGLMACALKIYSPTMTARRLSSQPAPSSEESRYKVDAFLFHRYT